MNGLNSYIHGKEQPSSNCTLPSSLLLLPQQKQAGVKMHVCFLLVQNSVWDWFFFFFPSELSLINSLKHLTLHRSSRHTSTCPSASSVRAVSCRWDRWLIPEAVQSTLVKSAAQLLMAQLCSQSPGCKLFLESSVWPSHRPILGSAYLLLTFLPAQLRV